jgi:hypothetical protein
LLLRHGFHFGIFYRPAQSKALLPRRLVIPRPLEQLSNDLIARYSIKAQDGAFVGGLSRAYPATIHRAKLTPSEASARGGSPMGLDVPPRGYSDEMLACGKNGLPSAVSSNINESQDSATAFRPARGEITQVSQQWPRSRARR